MTDTKENFADTDYERARSTLYEILEEAKEALDFAKAILRESEHPRAVEVYSGLLANVAKINSQILELGKTHKSITERKTYKDAGGDNAPQQITNNLFTGSTTDLQHMLIEAKDELVELKAEPVDVVITE